MASKLFFRLRMCVVQFQRSLNKFMLGRNLQNWQGFTVRVGEEMQKM